MKENQIPNIKLNNGVEMPILGFGTAVLNHEIPRVVNDALEDGYRFFDCAPAYGNQDEVCGALLKSGIPRGELFISTKLPSADRGYEKTLHAFDEVCKGMGLDYLDFYAIHLPGLDYDAFCESWRAMEKLCKEGRIRAIGFSSFAEVHIERILENCDIAPHANLLECNPFFTNIPCREYCATKGIHVVSWFSLGGPLKPLKPYPVKDFPLLLEDEVLLAIAEAHGKTAAQVALRWAVQNGMTPLVKAANREHMIENRGIFDFILSDVEMCRIDELNYDRRFGFDPMKYTENYP